MPGRKRVPTVIKQARGTLQPCRTNPNEPDYVLAHDIPDPPDFLSEYGRKVYYSTAEELLRVNVLTNISLPVFIMYCTEMSKYYEASQQLKKTSVVYKSSSSDPKVNPWQRVASDTLNNIMRIATEFGITPASAGKVKATPPILDPKAEKLKRMAK